MHVHLLLLSFMLLAQSSRAILPVDWPALTVSEQSPVQYVGDGTYYGANGDVNGSCGFNSNGANSLTMPWTSGTSITVAINDAQFAKGLSCGLCVKFRGTGTGIGTHPIPQQWTTAFVNNRCPECAPGSLDLGADGDGRWQIQWVPTPCNVGQSTFSYHITKDSGNPYWFSFVVSNTRIPLKNVELKIGGSWTYLRRDVSNSWNSNGLTYHAPFHLRLTSVLGDVVEDYIPSSSGGQGSAQFPEPKPDPAGAKAGVEALTPEYPGIAAADAAPVPVHWESTNGTWVKTTSSNPASPGTPIRLPSSTSPGAAASASGGASSSSSSSGSSPATSPASGSSAPQSSSGSLSAWSQCGGTYRCTSNCADAAYTDKQCGSGLTCSRSDSSWWQCRPVGQEFGTSSGSQQSSSSSGSSNSGGSSSNGSGSSSSSSSGGSSSSSNGASASASAGGGIIAYGGNLGSYTSDSSSSSSSGSGASASATAGRRMLRQR